MMPIQNIRIEEWSKVGLCTMSTGRKIMILVLSNQVEIMAKSPGQERRNPILDDWTPVLEFHIDIVFKYILSWPGETC